LNRFGTRCPERIVPSRFSRSSDWVPFTQLILSCLSWPLSFRFTIYDSQGAPSAATGYDLRILPFLPPRFSAFPSHVSRLTSHALKVFLPPAACLLAFRLSFSRLTSHVSRLTSFPLTSHFLRSCSCPSCRLPPAACLLQPASSLFAFPSHLSRLTSHAPCHKLLNLAKAR